MIYLRTSVGVEIRDEDLLLSSLQSNLAAGVFTHFGRIRGFRGRERAEVRRELDGFFKSNKLARDNVVLGLQRRDVVIRHLDLPAEVADNLKQVIQYQVQSYEPTEEERFYYDFAPARGSENARRLSVLLVMVKKSLLDGQLTLLRELGLQPVAVTCGSLGLINLFTYKRKDLQGKTFFLADLTAGGFEVLAVRDGRLAYTREALREGETSWSRVLLGEVEMAAGKVGLSPEDSIEQVILAGESAAEAREEITETLPDCALVDQMIRYEMPPENRRQLQVAATSLGLALTGLVRRPDLKVNLLPVELRTRRNRWAYVPTAILALTVIGLLVALGFRNMAQDQILARKLDQEIESLRPRVERVQGIQKQADALEKRVMAVEGLLQKRDLNLELLQELTKTLPPDTFLTVYTNKDGSIQISGASTSAPDLIPKLENSPMLKEVVQRGTVFRDVQTGKDRFNFEAKLER